MIYELFAVIFTLTSVILTIKQHHLCWLFGIFGVVLYSVVFFKTGLYAQFTLQFVFLYQMIYGIIKWKKRDKESKVTILNLKTFNLHFSIIILIFLSTLGFFKDIDNSIQSSLDLLTSLLGLLATYYLANRFIQAWLIWILVDVLLIIVFYRESLYLSMGVYFIFLSLSIIGFFKWKKDLTKV